MLRRIEQHFGRTVARIVAACSDTDVTPKPPWRERKEAYIAHLADADEATLRVSLADKLHNARAILFDLRSAGGEVWTRFNTGPEEVLCYYRALADAFEARDAGPMSGELRRTVDAIADAVQPRRQSPAARVSPDGPDLRQRIEGCVIGGAVGDALGAAVEFDSIARIRRRFGPSGISDPAEAYGVRGAITDDTQMTLFTAEGLIRAYVRAVTKGLSHAPSVVDHAYARWLATQGERCRRWEVGEHDGWLIGVPGLHHRRAPGNTCLAAMRADRMGTVDAPLNDSKGCGGVMRVAPAGLVARRYSGDIFELGCDTAALTHGHPSGYLAAGALAEIIARICAGEPLDAALDSAERRLRDRPRHEETLEALRAARTLAASGRDPSAEAVASLGEGWVAEEALAIAVYCALVARDFAHGVRLAVNHSGDSDSTAAMTGNILGALWGDQTIPHAWVTGLEVRDVVLRVAEDMSAIYGEGEPPDVENGEWWERYPGW
jgi:ADP-ribosylglycohydrolase